jgi:CBS domain-containing protein
VKARDIMTREVITATPDALIEDVAKAMLRHRISGVPVVENGRLVGILSEGDLLRRAELGTQKPHSRWLELLTGPGRLAADYVRSHARKVGEIMSEEIVSIAPDTPAAEIVALMESRDIKRLPVTDKGKLVGIVSRADLLRALAGLLPKAAATAVSDAEIRQRLLAEVDRESWAPRAMIDAVVKHGVVELRGAIMDGRERDALRVVAENIPGVTAVEDHLIWIEPLSGMVVAASEAEGAVPNGKQA